MSMEIRVALPAPEEIKRDYPLSSSVIEKKAARDKEIAKVFKGESDKFILIIGPCSADSEEPVLDYIGRIMKTL